MTSCRNASLPENTVESFRTTANQRVGNASCRSWCSCISAKRQWKELSQNNSLNMNRLSLAFRTSFCKIELGFHLKPYMHLKHSCCYRQTCQYSFSSGFLSCHAWRIKQNRDHMVVYLHLPKVISPHKFTLCCWVNPVILNSYM